MGYIEIETKGKTKITYAPCIKCGSEDIHFGDCGYSSFNVAYGKCRGCKKNDMSFNCGWPINISDIVKVWNKENDPAILREGYEKQIAELKAKIKALPKKKRTKP